MINLLAQQKSLQKATKSLHFCILNIKYLYTGWCMPNKHREDWYQIKNVITTASVKQWEKAASAAGTYDTQELFYNHAT